MGRPAVPTRGMPALPLASAAVAEAAITVLVADSQHLVADAIACALGAYEGLTISARRPTDGVDALDSIVLERPDVVVLDYWMADLRGPAALQTIQQWSPGQRVLLLSWFHGPDQIKAALAAGACGFLPKSIGVDLLVEAIRRAHAGESPVFAERLQRLIETLGRKCIEQDVRVDRLLRLTPREVAVLKRLAKGDESRVVAQELQIAPGTLRSHIHSILRKTGARSQLEAVAMARMEGLIEQ